MEYFIGHFLLKAGQNYPYLGDSAGKLLVAGVNWVHVRGLAQLA
jgi:hypothetical protein